MGSLHAFETTFTNPLEIIERMAEERAWSLDRTNECEVNLVVSGSWSEVFVSLNWRDELESLQVACSYEMKVPANRKVEVGHLFTLINSRLFHGHFDVWEGDGSIVYRNTLVLAGGAVMNEKQCETLIRLGLEYCERYYPAIQYVCWAGKTGQEALEASMFQTVGEA